jgi:lipoate-protein ligase A
MTAKPPRAWVVAGGPAAIVLGRSQHQLVVHSPLPVRRRASGGGAVLTGPWMLRAAVRLPRDDALVRRGPAAVARWFGALHLQWLQAQGVPGVEMQQGSGERHWACYARMGTGEIGVGGRKLVGIAQVWRRSIVLASAGTLLYPPPWEVLCEAMGHPVSEAAELAAATVTLAACAPVQLQPAQWAGSLRRALEDALCGRIRDLHSSSPP